jgi:hypothetical protein
LAVFAERRERPEPRAVPDSLFLERMDSLGPFRAPEGLVGDAELRGGGAQGLRLDWATALS